MTLQPRVTDISHHNTVTDLHATAAAGIWGVIHKATQGTGYRDDKYPLRRGPVADAGMLWGAYHFGDSSDPVAQVRSFLAYAQPGQDTLLCLDYEDHPSGRSKTMKPAQMVSFLREIERQTGRKAWLYSGNRIKEDIHLLSASDQRYVCQHPLWLCQYGPRPQLPKGFDRSILWQYTDGQVGPQPHGIPGIKGLVDLNMFNGTREDLEAVWIALHSEQPAVTADGDTEWSSQSKPARGSDDAGPADDDTSELPPFLQSRTLSGATGGLNVQPQTARYDVKVEIVQRHLEQLGYHEVGGVDGKWGGKTAAAIAAFYNDRGIHAVPAMSDQLNDAISDAVQDGWTRPVADTRALAKPEDLKEKNDAVKVSLLQRFWAKVAAGGAALGLTGSSLSNNFTAAKNALQPVTDAFNMIPGPVWFLIAMGLAGAVWYATSRSAQAVTKDFNTGKLN